MREVLREGNDKALNLRVREIYIFEEQRYKVKLGEILKELLECQDEDEMELLEKKIEDAEEWIGFLQHKQKEIVEKIMRDVRYGY